jgi:acyl-CoA synthetase (AMP-forming)/AMP-acid ligase II
MRGYLNNEKATKEIIDQDGWLHTGDICFFNNDGYVFHVGRMKELIKVQGFQVSPSELEDLLRRIPGVGDCAVIGVDVANKGEAPRAYIVRSDESLTEEKIHAVVKEKVARYKQLAGGIEFVKSIPKNATGKIFRRALKAMYDDTHE